MNRGWWRRLVRAEQGATAIEYGLIIALIVLAMFAGIMTLGGRTGGMWDNLSNRVVNA